MVHVPEPIENLPPAGVEEPIHADHECWSEAGQHVCVRIAAEADLPSRFGEFRIVAFWNNHDHEEHVALVHGDVRGQCAVPVRVHSECLTGEAFGSLRCDCEEQLEVSMAKIGKMDHGVVLYLRQEGRGIGLINKIRAYSLQDEGLDTLDANRALGFADDLRSFKIAAHMLRLLEVESVRLMTNNPNKIKELQENGIEVVARIPHEMPSNPHNEDYLRTKRDRAGHLLELD